MGVGSAENRKLVHWQIGKDLIASWFLTIPATAGIAAVAVVALRAIMGG
jgi:phosphate/sulfate permease